MAITLRSTKGSALTHAEMDTNFSDLMKQADGFTNAATLGTSPLSITSNTTYTSPIFIPYGFKFVVAAGINLHFAEGYYANDWNWCFDISATGATVTGDKAPGGYLTPQHFGADPTDDLVDDMPAIEAATEFATLDPIRSEYAKGFPVKFPDSGSGYYLTKTRPIYVVRTTRWFGENPGYGRSVGGVEIKADDGLDAVVAVLGTISTSAPEYTPENAPDHPTSPGIGKLYSGIRSVFEDLSFMPVSGATVRQGFVHNTVCYLRRCRATGFSEAQFHAHANTSGSFNNLLAHPGISNNGNSDPLVAASTMAYDGTGAVWGNVNGSIYEQCFANDGVAASGVNGSSHGFVAHGNNAGTVGYIKCDANGNQGIGFMESSTIGCEYVACHSAQNCYDVDHGGARWLCIKYHVSDASSEPGVGVDWQDYWVANTSGTGDTTWALSQTYHPTTGVNICVSASKSSLIGHYSEGGIEKGITARGATTVIGGNAAERTFWHGEVQGAEIRPTGGVGFNTIGYKGETTPGDSATEYGSQLGSTYTAGTVLQWGDKRDDASRATSAIKLSWGETRKRYSFSDASDSNFELCGFTGNGFSSSGYGSASHQHFYANGMYVAEGTAASTRMFRVRAAQNLDAITDATFGPAVRGDRWYYTDVVAGGKEGAVCTTAGTIGTDAVIREFGAIDA